MHGARRAGAAVATLAIAVAGCGATSAKHGEAAKSPQQIAADVVAATNHLHSYRMAGTFTDTSGTTRIAAAVAGPGRISYSEQRGSYSVEVIALGSVSYMKANRAYYEAQPRLTPAQVTTYTNRWLKLSNPSFVATLARATNLSLTARCWASRKHGMSVAGTTSVDGHPAVIVTSDGSQPGGAPGRVYVAATGPAWQLRAVVTGPRKPGGPAACSPSTAVRASDITLSDWNQPIALNPPPAPLDLTHLTP